MNHFMVLQPYYESGTFCRKSTVVTVIVNFKKSITQLKTKQFKENKNSISPVAEDSIRSPIATTEFSLQDLILYVTAQ